MCHLWFFFQEIIDGKQSEIDKLQNQNAQLLEKSLVTFEQKEPDFYSKVSQLSIW